MCSGSEAGSYLRRIDSCITQAQGPCRTCNEGQEEEEESTRVKGVSHLNPRRCTCLGDFVRFPSPPPVSFIQVPFIHFAFRSGATCARDPVSI